MQQQAYIDRSIRPGYAVRLVATGANKISVIKEIRAITGLGLKEAKDLSEQPGELIISGLAQGTANDIAGRMMDAGATVEVELIEFTK